MGRFRRRTAAWGGRSHAPSRRGQRTRAVLPGRHQCVPATRKVLPCPNFPDEPVFPRDVHGELMPERARFRLYFALFACVNCWFYSRKSFGAKGLPRGNCQPEGLLKLRPGWQDLYRIKGKVGARVGGPLASLRLRLGGGDVAFYATKAVGVEGGGWVVKAARGAPGISGIIVP